MYNKWKLLKKKEDPVSKAEMEALEEELAEDYFKKVKEAGNNSDCMDGGKMSTELWKLKKQLGPQSRETPTAMLDDEDNLVTNEEQIKQMALTAYKERLRNRPIKDGLENVKPWDMADLEDVLNKLKNN